MIEEEYVSFETAKLLKERGFNEDCDYFYDKEKEFHGCYSGLDVNNIDNCCGYESWNPECSAPSQAVAMRWLREKYHLYIEICTDKAHNFKDIIFRPSVYNSNLNCLYEADNFKTYEDAVEAAIKECLKNLIEHRFIV